MYDSFSHVFKLITFADGSRFSAKASSDLVLPSLDQLQTTLRKLAIDINGRLLSIENKVGSKVASDNSSERMHKRHRGVQDLQKTCGNVLKSAASVITSASTALAQDNDDKGTVVYSSDFGDVFPDSTNPFMLDWIKSNEISEEGAPKVKSGTSGSENWDQDTLTQPFGDWDSDEEEEQDLIQALYQQGKLSLTTGKYNDAEKDLQNCISRLSIRKTPENKSQNNLVLELDAMSDLITALRMQQKLDDAQKVLKERITLLASSNSKEDEHNALNDTLVLTEVLLDNKNYTEALLYGRRAYRVLKKQVPQNQKKSERALKLLIRICQGNGNHNDADAYLALHRQKFQQNSLDNKPSTKSATLEVEPGVGDKGNIEEHTKHSDKAQVTKTLEEKAKSHSKSPQFGMSLQKLSDRDDTFVPLVVQQVIMAVDKWGLQLKGIYCNEGNDAEIRDIKVLFDSSK